MRRPESAGIFVCHSIEKSVHSAFYLNCYEVLNASSLAWDVSTYRVERKRQRPFGKDPGDIIGMFWELRREFSSLCRGYGFILSVDDHTVAVPAAWKLPSGIEHGDHAITLDRQFRASIREPGSKPILAGIVKEGIKRHFKNCTLEGLGYLWPYLNSFCQMPDPEGKGAYYFCRRFNVGAKFLRSDLWAIEFGISTVTLDNKTFHDYYERGDVTKLLRMAEAKQANRLTRENRPAAIRVWRDETTPYQSKAGILEFDDIELITAHSRLLPNAQKSLADETVRCRPFKGAPIDVPLGQIRLILDSQITQDDHGDTIINPDERFRATGVVRDFVNGADIFGQKLSLAESPLCTTTFPAVIVAPPPIRVKDENSSETIIPSPDIVSDDNLKKRSGKRLKHIRRYGFLEQRPIFPLLACPEDFGKDRARRMKADLNHILTQQGIKYQFERYCFYSSAEQIRKEIERNGYDLLLAVLPEGSITPQYPDNMHDQIKQRVEVSSQCIQYDHTLPECWVSRHPRELKQADPKLAKRIRQRYELCLLNLLVKHHWVPFIPSDPFYYNAHVGIDVGGRHNNKAMACIGHGFRKPYEGLVFRPEEISVELQKVEPIYTDYLYRGLLRLFETVHTELLDAGRSPDFERTLFFRDGRLGGDGDEWNEKDALSKLHSELLNRGWISADSIWTVVEILKRAEGLRLFRGHLTQEVFNPIVGYCLFSFEDVNQALVCTTGSPYLTQGTASPLKIKIIDIYGQSDRMEVVRDLIWEADMCFSKPDVGQSIPWVLHVADEGALQLSRSYQVAGITV
jgi:hypothetical protein